MRALKIAALALSAGVAIAVTPQSAFAAPAPVVSSTSGAGANVSEHCVASALAVRVGEVSTVDPTVTCYDTFAEAIAHATGGAVTLKSGQRTLTAAQAATAVSSTVVGIEYKDSGFGGSSLSLTTPGSGFQCNSSLYVAFNSLPSGWTNSIGSARSYANCKSGHFEFTNNHGAVKICGCSTMGALNDNTESIRFSASGL